MDDWAQLYVYALKVLPLFDPSSIPSHLVVDAKGKCFLIKVRSDGAECWTMAAGWLWRCGCGGVGVAG